jgi:hypothetical protein
LGILGLLEILEVLGILVLSNNTVLRETSDLNIRIIKDIGGIRNCRVIRNILGY